MARESWTDARLDDFKGRVEHRFDEVDRRFDEVDRRFDEVDRRFDEVDRRFGEADQRFDRVESRLETLTYAVVFGTLGMSTAMVAGFVAILTQI